MIEADDDSASSCLRSRDIEDLMLRWRLMVEIGRKAGHTFSQPDRIIAATAAQHGLTVVSRDTAEYYWAGVDVIDPWTEAPSGSPQGIRP